MADDDEEAKDSLIVYPNEGFNSWISFDDAEVYFGKRINTGVWDKLLPADQEAALLTAFRSMSELTLDLSDLESSLLPQRSDCLKALQQAQCEQAQHELTRDLDSQQAQTVSIGGILSVRLQDRKETDRYSERTMMLLRPWLSRRSIKRFR